MKKLLSITLSLIMALGCLASAATAQAANNAECVNISIKGMYYNSLVQETFNEINAERSTAGFSSMKLDSSLTEIARKRAAECLVYIDKNDDYRPNGDFVSDLIPGNSKVAHGRVQIKSTAVTSITPTGFFDLFISAAYQDFKSLGLAAVGYGGVYVLYFVASENDSSSPYTNSSNGNASYTVQLNIKNITEKKIVGTFNSARIKYSLKTRVYAGGYYNNYFDLSNAQVNYKSSNPGVVKMKGSVAYFKKNGSFTVKSFNKSGRQIASYSDEITGLKTYLKPGWKSVKSKKKKTLSLTWQKNITDATGYQIQYSTNKKFKKGVKTVTINNKKTTSKTIKKLKSKKVYYIRIRAFIDQGEGEKLYSSWSTSKKIKIK